MEFIVASRSEIQRGIVVRTSFAAISISDPGRSPPRMRRTAGFRGALFLSFHDAEPPDDGPMPEGLVLFTKRDAERIWDFVTSFRGDAGNWTIGSLLVNCEGGVSRSAAVAAGICRALGWNDSHFFRKLAPNRHIYELMLETAADFL